MSPRPQCDAAARVAAHSGSLLANTIVSTPAMRPAVAPHTAAAAPSTGALTSLAARACARMPR